MTASICHVYLVRHAQSAGNALGIVQGHADFPLTSLGKSQARQRSQAFSKQLFQDCYASDLLRTRQTAEILSKPHGLQVKVTPLLREQNFGKFNGMEASRFEKEIDSVVAAHRQLPLEQRLQQRPHPEIESDPEMMRRMLLVLRSVALSSLNKNVLIVSHGGIMRSLLVELGYATFEQMAHTAISNCGYVQIDCDGKSLTVRSAVDITLRK